MLLGVSNAVPQFVASVTMMPIAMQSALVSSAVVQIVSAGRDVWWEVDCRTWLSWEGLKLGHSEQLLAVACSPQNTHTAFVTRQSKKTRNVPAVLLRSIEHPSRPTKHGIVLAITQRWH